MNAEKEFLFFEKKGKRHPSWKNFSSLFLLPLLFAVGGGYPLVPALLSRLPKKMPTRRGQKTRENEKGERKNLPPFPFSGILYTKKLCAGVVLSCTSSLLQSFFRNPTEIKKKADKKRKGRRTEVSPPFQEVIKLVKNTNLMDNNQSTGLSPSRTPSLLQRKMLNPTRNRKKRKKIKKEGGCEQCIPLCLSSISRLRFASLC